MKDALNGTTFFLVKVFALSALLSLSIKGAGRWIAVEEIEGQWLNSFAIALVLLPSLTIGTLLFLNRAK
ncbi:MAG: hypothetical protein AAFY72_18765 [Cyanobacteria bacterium J06649_4]